MGKWGEFWIRTEREKKNTQKAQGNKGYSQIESQASSGVLNENYMDRHYHSYIYHREIKQETLTKTVSKVKIWQKFFLLSPEIMSNGCGKSSCGGWWSLIKTWDGRLEVTTESQGAETARLNRSCLRIKKTENRSWLSTARKTKDARRGSLGL